ncbi:MAG: hypothetical protein OEW58_09450 [Gammaproteobacteria bacterium]|nr:hypothetical protein [Gammaproteobacteria bacterium]
MQEVNLLITVAGVMFLVLFFTLRFFVRRAKAKGEDTMVAARNGLFVALILFAAFVVLYEDAKADVEIVPLTNCCFLLLQ